MLKNEPLWRFTARAPLTRWYEHVRLLPDRIVGQWFCLDRSSGVPIWEQRLERPDEVVGIESGVIVANERWRQSFGSARSGCYGISLETGKLLWTSHAPGLGGWILWLLDFLPDYPNILFRDRPISVLDGKCYCKSGRVLDLRTGRQIERVPAQRVKAPQQLVSQTEVLGRTRGLDSSAKLKMGNGVWLSHKLGGNQNNTPTTDEYFDSVWDFRLFATDDNGEVKWFFDVNDTGYETCYCPYEEKCRYSFPYLYLLACEKRTTRRENSIEVYNPSEFHLLTLDLVTGQIVQDIPVLGKPVESCRFEDIDAGGVLASDADRTLLYFAKSTT